MAGVAGLLVDKAAASPNAVALRERSAGLWNETTYAAYLDEAARVGTGLVAVGLRSGDRVGLVSENHPSWLAADIGAQGVGAVVVAVDPDTPASDLVAAMARNRVVVVVVGDQEQFDKLDEHRSLLPDVRTVVVVNTRGLRYLDHASSPPPSSAPQVDVDDPPHWTLMTYADLLARGDAGGAAWKQQVGALDSASTATVLVVAGQPDRPVSHAELVAAGHSAVDALSASAQDSVVAVVSWANPTERAMSEVGPLIAGFCVHVPQSGSISQGVADVQPTLLHAPATLLGQIAADGARRAAATPGIARRGVVRVAGLLFLLLPGFLVKGLGGSKALSGRLANFGLLIGGAIALYLYHRPDALAGEVSGLKRFAFRSAANRNVQRRSVGFELRIFRLGLAIAVVATIVVCALVRSSTAAWVRLLIVAALIGGYLVFSIASGLAVRPFIRRRYGLGRAREVVTPLIPSDPSVRSFFSTIGITIAEADIDHRGFLTALRRKGEA